MVLASKGGISGNLLNQLAQMDGLIHVVRVFSDENVPHVRETIDPFARYPGDGQRTRAERPDFNGT